MADITIDVNPQQQTIDASPKIQQENIPVEVNEVETPPTYWGQILGDIDDQLDLKESLDGKQNAIPDLDKYLKNDTTQDNGLAVIGTVSGSGGTAMGDNATASRAGVAIGCKAETLNYGVAIGGTDDNNTITHAHTSSVAIGYGAVCSASGSAQIGQGENNTGGTLQFKGYQILNQSGNIPDGRIPQLASKANIDLSNLSDAGEAKFDAKMDIDASNANPRLATYAELQQSLQEVKNMMLGHIDWANKVNITITLTGGAAQNSYTCPSNGYLFPSMGGAAATNALVNGVIVFTSGTGTAGTSARAFSGELSGLIPVCEGDILSASKATGNFSTTLIFIPQKEA